MRKFRIEICPLYAHEEPNIKAYTKDFNIIHKYTDVQNQKNQAETDLLDAVKNNPDTLKLVEEYLLLKKQGHWLYSISTLKTGNPKSINKPKELPLDSIKAYVLGVLNGLGIEWIRSLRRIPNWHPMLIQSETTCVVFFFLRSLTRGPKQ